MIGLTKSKMKPARPILFFLGFCISAPATHATKPVALVPERFANREAIRLNLQAQTQMDNGDLKKAADTIELALRTDPTLWLTRYMRARLFIEQYKYDLAVQDCNWVLWKYPKFVEAALVRARANSLRGRYDESLQELNHVVRIRPHMDSYARALLYRADFLATCPNASYRNGQQAVNDAKIACKLTNWSDGDSIAALAAAFAEVGDFDSAVLYAQQSLTVRGVSSERANLFQRRLALFEQHKRVPFSQ